ncbi:hypothetical protein NL108_017437 [Boleophthalmus pectinirostris]|uniref:trace amine-associated receptor 1-like n=1 Tax=Boleophthalmus pectinirostris TaxID=150288 RepID=UPI000A1C1B99|nr:trace amine-associated receptor 1-like [Boleophthalmus pectinirostris]KAJ0058578.1 hypothetical protein NL108_017437 [Boleophthalmus pectinirostris]
MDNVSLSNTTVKICNMREASFLLPVCTILAIVTLVTLCGNVLVIISIAYFRQLHTLTNYLVLSLAVSDLLIGIMVLPFVIFLFVTPCSPLHDVLCRVRGFFDMLLCLASILNLFCICIERYYAVCQPLSYQTKINSRIILGMIFMVWSLSSVLSFVLTFGGNKSKERCAIVQILKLSVIAAVIAFHIPFVVMFTLYMKILLVVRRQARSIHTASLSDGVSKAERRATLMLAMVIGVFFICWAPVSICATYQPFNHFSLPLKVMEIFKFLAWLNSMLNPFIYAYSHSLFRSAFRFILMGKIYTKIGPNARLQ